VKFYLNYRTFYQVMPKCRIHIVVRFFCDTLITLRQMATVVMETAQLVLSQFKKFLTSSNEN